LDGHSSLTQNPSPRSSRTGVVVLAALLAVAAALVWLLLDRLSEAPAPRSDSREEPAPAPSTTPPPPAAVQVPEASVVKRPLPEGAIVVIDPPELEHPHPITPEREHIQRENQILGAMNDAMDLGNGARLREILTQYRDEYPEDPNQLQEGYQIIADCLEHPGAASTAAGRRYYDVERGSILRLFVGRHCLENAQGSSGPGTAP
jgi:hypothetical protein